MVKYPYMLSLLILIIFGLGMAYFATQNTGIVHVTLANYAIQNIPLYGLVLGSVILGIFISSLISMVNAISSNLKFRGKETQLREANRTIESLKKENNALHRENTHLKTEQKREVTEEKVH